MYFAIIQSPKFLCKNFRRHTFQCIRWLSSHFGKLTLKSFRHTLNKLSFYFVSFLCCDTIIAQPVRFVNTFLKKISQLPEHLFGSWVKKAGTIAPPFYKIFVSLTKYFAFRLVKHSLT